MVCEAQPYQPDANISQLLKKLMLTAIHCCRVSSLCLWKIPDRLSDPHLTGWTSHPVIFSHIYSLLYLFCLDLESIQYRNWDVTSLHSKAAIGVSQVSQLLPLPSPNQRWIELKVRLFMCMCLCVDMSDSKEQLDKGMKINNKWKASSRLPVERVQQRWILGGRGRNKEGKGRTDGFPASIHF